MFNLRLSIVLKTQGAFAGIRQIIPSRNASVLGHLEPNEGAVKEYRRLGRGASSGLGKTSGRGQKGQKARGSVPMWFEGGQTPFFKRFPKTGFNRANTRVFHELNLDRIQDFWNNGRIPLNEGETLTIQVMRKCGLITGSLKDGVKILSNGAETYNVPLNVEATKASNLSIETIEKLGHEYTAVYRTRLGLRAHVSPDHFLRTRGYVPLQARPTHRRDIGYYSNQDKRGYLLKNRSLLLDYMGKREERKKVVRLSGLQKLLKDATVVSQKDFQQSATVNFADL